MLTSITLAGSGRASRTIEPGSLRSAALEERVRREANAWIKRLRVVPYDGESMRTRFTFRGDSLWWFTELYLHKMRQLEDALATIFTLEALVDEWGRAPLTLSCDRQSTADAARAFGRTHGVDVVVTMRGATPPRASGGAHIGLTALASRLRPRRRPHPGPSRVAAFVHAAFWRASSEAPDGRESYIGEVLDAITAIDHDAVRLVGVGPRRTFRTRRWWDPVVTHHAPRVTPIEQFAPRAALAESLALWRDREQLARTVTSGDGIRKAGHFGSYDLWPVLSAELAAAARVQWPWSARAMDEARAALRSLEPDVALTYAEAGGWGRALVLEARRLGVPTVGLQHGFIYRHWLNYQHEPDEMVTVGSDNGFPRPTLTLLFDRYARETLETSGHFPADALAVTGSARLDRLVARLNAARADGDALRRSIGVAPGTRLLVLAAKASEIGAHLPALFAAVNRPELRLLVKPHPAETRDAYEAFIPAGAPVTIHDPQDDLGRLLAVADALVTMNSTVALDALVLGIPALVIGLPNNLSPFVDAGVMLGAPSDDIGSAIDTLLYDRQARQGLLDRGRAFAETYGLCADGGAARRAADCILAQRTLTDRECRS